MTVDVSHDRVYRTVWSKEDGEFVGLCGSYPSLSWLASTPGEALNGIRALVAEAEVER